MTRFQPFSGFMSLVVLAVAACSGDRPSVTSVVTTVDTINGIEVVRNAGAPPTWTITETLTLGRAGIEESARDDEFGRITGQITDPRGNIYVADSNAHEIRVFDGGGVLIRRIGREGSGPGEFKTLQSIGWLGDTLAVLDPGNARMGLFDTDGTWIGQRPFMALTGGSVRLYPTTPTELYMPSVDRSESKRGMVYVRQTMTGPSDTVAARLSDASAGSGPTLYVTCEHSAGQGISSYSADLAPKAIVVPAPNGMRATVWSSDYRIAFINAAGDTVRIIERDLPTEPLTDDEWRDEERKFRKFLDVFADEKCEPGSLPRPLSRRRILGLFFDDAGRLWAEAETRAGRGFDVFDERGHLLGTLQSPVRYERVPPFVRGNRLSLVVLDSLDVHYVKVFDIGR